MTPEPGKGTNGRVLVILAVAALLLWAGYHVLEAEVTKGTPPAACQLLGGTWDIWSGWRCG